MRFVASLLPSGTSKSLTACCALVQTVDKSVEANSLVKRKPDDAATIAAQSHAVAAPCEDLPTMQEQRKTQQESSTQVKVQDSQQHHRSSLMCLLHLAWLQQGTNSDRAVLAAHSDNLALQICPGYHECWASRQSG